MNILVTGGCGYKGSVLVPLLLADGHDVTSIDTQWFERSPKASQVEKSRMDVRDTDAIPLDGVDAIIHLLTLPTILQSN